MPFLTIAVQVAGGKDYRRSSAAAGQELPSYFSGSQASEQIQQQWQALLDAAGQPEVSCELPVSFGRVLWVPRAVAAPAVQAVDGKQGHELQSQQHSHQHSQQHSQQLQQASSTLPPTGTEGSLGGAVAGGTPALAAVRFTFVELCGHQGTRPGGSVGGAGTAGGGALSAVDYLSLCQQVHTLFIEVRG